jgi:hypothetical protein
MLIGLDACAEFAADRRAAVEGARQAAIDTNRQLGRRLNLASPRFLAPAP